MTTKPAETATAPKPKAQSYVKGSHAARVRIEQDERRVELLALQDVLCAQRDGLIDQIDDIGEALRLLSEPGVGASAAWPAPVAMAAE